ncbi:L,D-transpeptidase [Corynebacterium caspium]|uniref:L,D-transpeptidase n=1 Tax=Corynebacterium caspium TaxID=234828 RepID=UPI00036A95BA|nr:L,D-transpeptidase [Corynebacterium caspium]WKD59821.1 hypothetical protein CCASP_07210 [Corynebacterium caspium DSM 44850]
MFTLKTGASGSARFARRFSAALIALVAGISALTVAAPAPAQAAESAQFSASIPSGSSQGFFSGSSAGPLGFNFGNIHAQFAALNSNARQGAWNLRQDLQAKADRIGDPNIRRTLKRAIDDAAEIFFPRLIVEFSAPAPTPAPAPQAPSPVPGPAPASPQLNSPCPVTARACVDLRGGRTWLQRDGKVEYGPVVMSAGAPSPETETPTGSFRVNRKVRHEISRLFNDAPMPYSVYFTHTGIAFHQGDVRLLSHGCIHLRSQDAAEYFSRLNIGDEVFVF